MRASFFSINKIIFANKIPVLLLVLLLALLVTACSRRSGGEAAEGKPLIAVSILPQKYFASRIGGDLIETTVLVGPGQNPHNYEPTPRQISDLAVAKAWVLSGAEFEISLKPKIENLFSGLKIVDGTEGARFRSLEEQEEHEDGDDDHLDGIDRHTWLGRENVKILAGHIRDLFVSIDEPNAAVYHQNCDALVKDIDAVFDSLKIELEPLRGRTVYVYHPSFGYFLDEFGIVQRAVETGGKEPTPRQLALLIEQARQERVTVIFVQAQFPVESARTAAASAGAEIVSLDPLAEDWLANIRLMGEALEKAAQGLPPEGENL
jgi:zinc transport system substrate-binding protein